VQAVDITIDLPVDANLPRTYVARDDVRMEAYRRLAAVASMQDVDDIRDEWEDRYGPPPPEAVALLDAARLRAVAVRLGVTSITVQRNTARVVGLSLRESQKVRLRRLAPKAVAKSASPGAPTGEVVVPLAVKVAEVAAALVDLLDELVPPEPPAESAEGPALASAAQ
jgi:transcription-repair coupling factor (superfamily II helicase)